MKAELFPAAEWICDSCGKNNFVSIYARPIIQDEEEGHTLALPNSVICSECLSEYEAEFIEDEN